MVTDNIKQAIKAIYIYINTYNKTKKKNKLAKYTLNLHLSTTKMDNGQWTNN